MKRLLRHLVGPDLAESILGDLEEQARLRWPRSRLRGAAWRAGQVVSIIAAAIAERARRISPNARHRHRFGRGARVDVRIALRSLRRTPWYAATAAGVLALGISLATTVLAVVDGVLLKPLPYPRVRHVVSVEGGWRSQSAIQVGPSSSDVLAWIAAVPEVRFGYFQVGLGTVQVDDGEPARSAEASDALLEVLGQPPLIGGFQSHHFSERTLIRPALLTHGAWQRRFASDPTVVGRVFHGEDGRGIQVVGILPKDFLFPSDHGRFIPEVITPLVLGPNAATNRSFGLHVVARLPASISAAALESRLTAAAAEVARRFPPQPGQRRLGPFDIVRVVPIDDALRSGSRETFALVLALSLGLVLLACLNVTGLGVARAQDRRREVALRRVLGASGGDLIRLIAVENALVVGLGSAIGLAASWYFTQALAAFLPDDLVLLKALTIDRRIVLLVLGLSALVVLLTTLWPSRVVLASDVNPSLAGSGRTTGPQRTLGRFVRVGSQVALALILAVGGALLVGSLVRVWREDPGYDVSRTMNLWLADRATTSRAEVDALLDDLRRLPGVTAAGGYNIWLAQRAMLGSRGFEPPPGAVQDEGEGVGVTSGFFDASGLAPVAGRWPTEQELSSGARVVAVSEQVARGYWPGEPAVGQVLSRRGEPYVVVGVVPDARYLSLDGDPFGVVYYPLAADSQPVLVSVFLAYDRRELVDPSAVRALIAERQPRFRVRSAQAVTATLADSIRARTLHALLLGSFGVSAVVIVAVGVLGLAAIVTSRRTREIGVRLALGARPAGILTLVMRQELIAVLCGVATGGLIAVWLARVVDSLLYKTTIYDPASWIAGATILLGTTTLGILVPAVRASRTDPVTALRVD